MLQLLVVLLSLFVYQFEAEEQIRDLCLTQGCIHAAADILRSIDENIDPCNDFYQFVCGNTIEEFGALSKDKQYIDEFSSLADRVQQQLRIVLETPIQKYDSKSVILAKKYYKACLNEELVEKLGKTSITDLLKELGGWPVLEGDSWTDHNFTWTSLIHKLRQRGIESGLIIKFSVSIDAKNSSIRSIELDQPSDFGLFRELLVENKYTDIYFDLMVKIAAELGANEERAKIELKESLEFEKTLANLSLPQEQRRNYTLLYNPIRIFEMDQEYPGIEWLEYLNRLLPPEVQVSSNDTVVILVPKYFESVAKLVKETPNRVIANYILWRVVKALIPYLPNSLYEHLNAVEAVITGQAERPERWKECVKETYNDLSKAVASMYIRKYFDNETKTKAGELVKYVRNVFGDNLKILDWMDNVTRKRALQKAEKVEEHIGYPVELLDDNVLNEFYKTLIVSDNQYLKSYLNISKHTTDSDYGQLFELVNKTDWKGHSKSYDVGAYYSRSENSIELPAGILQGTFFDKNRPMYLNFGAIGSIIGHELTHGFDDQGRQLDDNGNLNSWWERQTEEKFLEKIQCVINQYGNYTVKEINNKISGITTQGENIADNGGLKQAYLAYNNWIKANGVENMLPALNYTPHQLFWISAAKNWCAKFKPQYLETLVKVDHHSPHEFRVLGPFSNFKQFSEDFNCPVGSTYNPVQRCSVW